MAKNKKEKLKKGKRKENQDKLHDYTKAIDPDSGPANS